MIVILIALGAAALVGAATWWWASERIHPRLALVVGLAAGVGAAWAVVYCYDWAIA